MRLSRRAFSLLEILITGLIIALALAPLVISLKTSTRSVTGTREMLSAVAYAQFTLEELRRAAFRPVQQPGVPAGALPGVDDMVAAMNADGDLDATGKGNAKTENAIRMVRKVRLIPDKVTGLTAGMPDLRVVQVDITWKTPGGGLLAGDSHYQLHSLLGSGTQP